jgi:hypothetical protein
MPAASLSDPEYLDYSERGRTVTLAATAAREVNVGGATADPERALAAFVTANTFDVLGVTPALGRGFRQARRAMQVDPVVALRDE